MGLLGGGGEPIDLVPRGICDLETSLDYAVFLKQDCFGQAPKRCKYRRRKKPTSGNANMQSLEDHGRGTGINLRLAFGGRLLLYATLPSLALMFRYTRTNPAFRGGFGAAPLDACFCVR
jgi:hypothetical protein